jgi:hypothetical protein
MNTEQQQPASAELLRLLHDLRHRKRSKLEVFKAERQASGAFVYDDGGRAAAGMGPTHGGCVARATAIATGRPYVEVHAALSAIKKRMEPRSRKGADSGVPMPAIHQYFKSIGWKWKPTTGVRLRPEELPSGRLVVARVAHVIAVIDGDAPAAGWSLVPGRGNRRSGNVRNGQATDQKLFR